MKQLTKKQRNCLYMLMLAEIENPQVGFVYGNSTSISWGFCYLLIWFFDVDVIEGGDKVFKKELPELYAKKPAVMYDDRYWFKPADFERRKELILQCIEETL